MSLELITRTARIVKNGGPITDETHRSHATQLWRAGALLKLASGLLLPCTDTSGAAVGSGIEIDTADTGSAGARLFLAIEDHLTAGTVYVAVQEILNDTILELPLIASGATAPSNANVTIGLSYTGFQTGGASISINGTTYNIAGTAFGLDVDDTTNPVFHVMDKETQFNPYNPDNDDNYATVYAKVKSAILA